MEPIRNQRQKGFTLIETIVAIVVITTGLVMLAHLMVVSIALHEDTEAGVKSIELAQAKMESLKAQFNNSLLTGSLPGDLSTGSHGPITVGIQTDEQDTQNFLNFDLNWVVTDLAGGQKQIILSVSPVTSQAVSYGNSNQTVVPVTITSVLAP